MPDIDERRIETRLGVCPWCNARVIQQRDWDASSAWVDYEVGQTRVGEVHVCKEDSLCDGTASAG